MTDVGGTNLATSSIAASRQSTYVAENEHYDALLPSDPYAFGSLITGEVWGSTGGKSVIRPKPAYQRLVNTGTAGRAVPDVSMQMGGCPIGSVSPCAPGRSAAFEYFGCKLVGAVGTSASAPEFAGLLAAASQAQDERFGNVNPLLYASAAEKEPVFGPLFHTDIPGNNGVVSNSGSAKYDVITGVGTPILSRLLNLPFGPVAGTPRSPTNP